MDELYIRMCREAWPYLESQLGYDKDLRWCDGTHIHYKTPLFIPYTGLTGDRWVHHILYTLKEPFESEDFIVPNQEDLQELIINQTHLIPARILMLIYDEFEFIPAHLPEKSKIGIATLQVAMAMYGKRWNGTTWEALE